jgi:hypothetical protein
MGGMAVGAGGRGVVWERDGSGEGDSGRLTGEPRLVKFK